MINSGTTVEFCSRIIFVQMEFHPGGQHPSKQFRYSKGRRRRKGSDQSDFYGTP